MEFENPTIESLQESVARDFEFRITHHTLELYGTCNHCLNKGKSDGIE